MDDDKLTAQFSSGQLVIGICVSLFVLLAAFLLGVLVGKYDSSLRAPESVAAPSVKPTGVAPDTAGRQTTPRRPEPVTLPPVEKPDVDTSQGRVVEVAPLPASETVAPPVAEAIALPPPPPSPPAPSVPIEPPATLPQPAAAPAETVIPPPAVPAPEAASASLEAVTVPATPPSPVLEPSTPVEAETAVAPPPAEGFGIQVISLSGPDRAAKSVEVQRKLQASGYQSIVQQFDGGKKYAVMVVGFSDKAAADAASQELKKIKEFKDCFVKKLS